MWICQAAEKYRVAKAAGIYHLDKTCRNDIRMSRICYSTLHKSEQVIGTRNVRDRVSNFCQLEWARLYNILSMFRSQQQTIIFFEHQ